MFRTLSIVAALATAAVTAADSVTIVLEPGDPLDSTTPISGINTTADLMAGMTVRALFEDGSDETVVWQATGLKSGAATGTGWSISAVGDTFADPWTIVNSSGQGITMFELDGGPGETLFDLSFGDAFGTEGTGGGWTFEVLLGLTGLDIIARYCTEVGVQGASPVGDIYQSLKIEFTNAGGFSSGRQLAFRADTDNIEAGGELIPGVSCIWDNGAADGVDGQVSGLGTSIGDARTTDDFCLKDGYVYRVDEISVQMITDTTEPEAVLNIYESCNGYPGELIDCGVFSDFTYEVLQEYPDGFSLLEFTFDTSARLVEDEYGEITSIPGLWLKGGCYWLSPVGIGDGTGYDRYFWGGTAGNLIGAVAKTQAGEYKVDGWTPVDELNINCRNFSFEITGEACCIIRENGEPSSEVVGAVDTTGVGCRNADNFVVSACEDMDVCFFSAYVWTNCDCERTKIAFHEDDCETVGLALSEEILASKCVQLTGFGSANGGVDVDGRELALYRVEWHGLPDLGITLAGGKNYWAVLHVQGSGSFNERGFWAFNGSCSDSCTISISAGQAICPPSGLLTYESVGADYAFCLAGTDPTRASSRTAEAPETTATTCASDYTGDGLSTIEDLLAFLVDWFNGCE